MGHQISYFPEIGVFSVESLMELQRKDRMPRKTESTKETTNSTEISKEDHHIQDFNSQAANAKSQGDWKQAARYYEQGLEQRAVELALINSVQEGLSSKYEMQAIYDWLGINFETPSMPRL